MLRRTVGCIPKYTLIINNKIYKYILKFLSNKMEQMNEIRQLTTTTGEWQTTKLDVQWPQRTFKAYILNEHKRKTTNEKHQPNTENI